jgi:CRISPR-associated protein Csa1
MYFLSDEERRLVLRRLLPQARQSPVENELRGWNWDKPPLCPVYGARLGVFEVAGQYCPSGRDVYLRRVMGVSRPPNAAMLAGGALHRQIGAVVLAAKRAIYTAEPATCLEALGRAPMPALDDETADALLPDDAEALREQMIALWHFEQRRIVARVEEALARQPRVGVDGLAALALPVVVEQRLDGTFLGLSAHLAADAFTFAEPMVLDVKFGKPEPFHRLTTTGYALVMESLYEYPISVGCIVYPRFVDGRVLVERDFHLISDELRQWFIEARDERARLVEEEVDPGLAAACYVGCPFTDVCHPA